MNKTYQQELIGILGNKPQYFNITILTKNFFDEPFDIMFEEMRMCYIQEKQINYTRIFENKDIDDDLFISCISNVIHTYEGYFKSLEKQAIEKFKVKMIHEYNKKLLGEDIDVNKFTSLVEDLKKLSIIDTNKLTSKKIKEYTKKKNN